MHIKIRPSVIIISSGLVATLIIVALGIMTAIGQSVSGEVLAAVIGFGGAVTTVLGTALSKLVESEEKGD